MRRSVFVLLEIVAGLLALLALAGGVLAWRLAHAPIQVDWLTPHLRTVLDREGPGRLRIGGTQLGWAGFGAPLDIRAVGVQALDAYGQPVADVPEVRLTLSLAAALRGRVAPESLELVGPAIRAVRRADGSTALDIGTELAPADVPDAAATANDPGDGEALPLALQLLDTLRTPPDPQDPLGALRRVRISAARLQLEDLAADRHWTATVPRLDLARDADGLRIAATLDLDIGAQPARFEATGDYRGDDGTTTLTLAFAALRPSDLAAVDPALAPLAALDMGLGGTATVRLDPQLRPTGASLDLRGTAGRIVLPELYPEPLPVTAATLRATLSDESRLLTLDRVALDLGLRPPGRGKLVLTGTVRRDPAAYGLDLRAELTGVPMSDLGRWWPEAVKPKPRTWMLDNLEDGVFDRTVFEFAATAPPDRPLELTQTHLLGRFAFSGFTVHYRKPLPPVREVAGTATFDGANFAITLTEGSLDELRMGTADLFISGLETSLHRIDITVPVAGPVATALRVIDHEPLNYASKLNLDPASVAGEAAIELRFAFPLVRTLTFDEVNVAAAAKLSGVAISGIVPGIAGTEGQLALDLDNERLAVTGSVRLNGVPAEIDWAEIFADGAEVTSRFRLLADLDGESRTGLGLDLSEWMEGTAGLDLVYAKRADGAQSLLAEVDLARASLRLPQLGWSKALDEPGLARVEAAFRDGRPTDLHTLSLAAGGLDLEGRAELDGQDYALRRVVLGSVRLGETDVRLQLDARDGGYVVDLRGATLDARPLLEQAEAVAEEPTPEDVKTAPSTPLDVTVALDRVVTGDEGQELREVTGLFSRRPDGWDRVQVEAAASGGGRLSLRYAPEGDARELVLESDDAGGALRDLNLVDSIRGGRLLVTGRSEPGDAHGLVTGRIELRDYELQDAPVIARLLSAASPRGFANFVSGQPIAFRRLIGNFHWHDRGVSFREVRTSGAALGLTLEGDVDIDAGTLDVQGTVVPFSAVNRLLGNIPLVGDLLMGGEGQGLLAATYRVRGPLGDPDVGVNPLAVLTPGFLRNLFFVSDPAGTEGRMPEGLPELPPDPGSPTPRPPP